MNEVIQKDRKFVSKLVLKVLAGHMKVQKAIIAFPSSKDPSIQASWHALVHYEADEDMRKRDLAFAETQDETLEMIAFTLQEGKELPQNIISAYNKYYDKAMLPIKGGIAGFFESLIRFTF